MDNKNRKCAVLTLAVKENNRTTGEILFCAKRAGILNTLQAAVVDITPRLAPERARVEGFIRDIYARAFGARISIGYPMLMSVRDINGTLLAAAGFRFAENEPLFLEQYTGAPIENLLRGPCQTDVVRARIVEIGNLAATGNGASVFLFAALASYLHYRNISHAVVTGTERLHRQFVSLGLAPEKICDAHAAALSSERDNWGIYYDTHPRVLAGSIPASVGCLQKKLGTQYQEGLPPFFPRLHY